MQSFLLDYYLTLKAFHVISFISWMAALLYLPRIYVYHSQTETGDKSSELFKTMETKLLRVIMNPAMIATFIFGFAMLYANPDLLSQGWMHAKLLLVFLMAGFHGFFAKVRKEFSRDERKRSEKAYRFLNEGPAVLMVAIVFLAVLKSF